MRMLGAALLAVAVAAAAAPKAAVTTDKEGERSQDKVLLGRAPESWLKVYPLPIYKELWRLELSVRDAAQALPKVRQAFARVGASMGESAQDGPKVWRMSFRCSQKSSRTALLELKKIGACGEPVVRPIVEPVSLSEVQGKIKALEADKDGHAAELSSMPAISALVEELLGHLRGVEASLRRPEAEVLLQLTVKAQG